MSSPTLALGSLRAAHVRLFVPWQGRWIADVDVDLGDARTVPSGAQTLHVGAAELAGTVDPDRVGRFGAKASLRLLGGGAGWQKTVAERHYHNDAGVRTDAVLSTTAAEVGEKIVDTSPVRLGVDFTRARGPASQVLEGLDWRVDLDGTTVVGARKTIAAPATLQVLDWDGDRQRAELASDEIVTPGTQITDDRFGTIVVRDVEQTFSDGAARATAWCGPSPASRLMGALTSLVRHKTGARHFLVVTALGADSRSPIFYNRLKGEVEDSLMKLDYPSLTIARPSVLVGDRKESRRSEKLAWKFGFLMPKKYKPVQVASVARALVNAARLDLPGVRIIQNKDILQS